MGKEMLLFLNFYLSEKKIHLSKFQIIVAWKQPGYCISFESQQILLLYACRFVIKTRSLVGSIKKEKKN